MDKAVLLTKLHNYNDKSFELFNYYLDGTSKSFADNITEFETCINDIKKLTDYQYDFAWLSENAETFGVNRREFKALCDDVCAILGNRVQELCAHTREPIITKPTKYEDYCPFSSENLVVYGNPSIFGSRFMFDGNRYRIVDSKLENSPYYSIYCSSIE